MPRHPDAALHAKSPTPIAVATRTIAACGIQAGHYYEMTGPHEGAPAGGIVVDWSACADGARLPPVRPSNYLRPVNAAARALLTP